MKIGIVFSGQGAQYPGMGKDLYENFDESKEIFEQAGKQIQEWTFNGTKEDLMQTQITQPCVYTVTMAAYQAFMKEAKENGILDEIEIVGLAGFSLGEYAALTVGETIKSVKEGIEIVKKRGQLMQAAGTDEAGNPCGAMVAAFGDREKILTVVKATANGRILQGVNFNSPAQTVVAGEIEAIEDFVVACKAEKIKARKLNVSTAFHSAMMAPAAKELKEFLLSEELKIPTIKIYSNTTAEDITKAYQGDNPVEYMASAMAKQAENPVYWQETVENMVKDGAKVILEIGPGKTLSAFTKKITEDAIGLNVEDMESLKNTIESLKEVINA